VTVPHPDITTIPLDALLGEVERRRVAAVVDAMRATAIHEPTWTRVAECGMPARTVRAAAARGEIVIRRIGCADYVSRAAVDAWVAARPARVAPALDGDEFDVAVASGRVRRIGGGR
jgi:hypothetical protein